MLEFLVFAQCIADTGLVQPVSDQWLYDHINTKTDLCQQPVKRKIVSAWAHFQ